MSSKDPNESGAGKKSGPAFLLIGRLGKTHGIYGEIDLQIYTDFPERLKHGRRVYLGLEKIQLSLDTVRPKNKVLLISFDGYNSPEEARALTNQELFIKTSDVPALPEGQFYHHELLGLDVYEGSVFLGELTEILETKANDVFVIKNETGRELLLPDIPEVILKIDLEAQRVSVSVPDGLRHE
ncbi:MAG: ribosome maturation factor RimM [Anaerolineaceae bacterium]|nr:ribosome maturation factor RimM [Anaerolineaceae bacterium]